MYSTDALSLIVDDTTSRLSHQELNDRLEQRLAALSDLERESFDDVLKTIGSGAQTALPGVVQGATAGAAAGPWGALIGGVAGGAISLATAGSKQQAPPPPPHAPPPAPAPVPVRPPEAASPPRSAPTPVTAPAAVSSTSAPAAPPSQQNAPAAAPPGPNAAAQLLWAMQQPAMRQALAALVAGSMGSQQIPVGSSSAGPAAFLNLLNVLSSQAAEQAESYVAQTKQVNDAYLRDAEGEYGWDVVNPEARAQALLVHLQQEARATRPAADGAGAWLLRAGLAELAPDDNW